MAIGSIWYCFLGSARFLPALQRESLAQHAASYRYEIWQRTYTVRSIFNVRCYFAATVIVLAKGASAAPPLAGRNNNAGVRGHHTGEKSHQTGFRER